MVPAYAASKGGVGQLTKAFANEWASKGVNVNAIAPGYMATDNTEALQNDSARSRQILERIRRGDGVIPGIWPAQRSFSLQAPATTCTAMCW